MKKKIVKKNHRKKFLWSLFFLAVTTGLNISFVFESEGSSWVLVFAALSSAIALILTSHEKITNRIGHGRFLWSMVFASLALAFGFYIAGTDFTFWPILSVVSTIIALLLLDWEKRNS